MDLPSVLGGLAQGFKDFGTSVVDLFGTGGAAIGDLLQGTGTRNQDDFRKWLYNTNSVQDAAAKGLGTALNGVQTVSDYIPGIGAVTRNPLFNAAQGALGGLADEFKMNGENYDLGRAGQRAAVSGAAALAGSSLGDALKKSANPLLKSGLAQGLARGATGGAINQGGYAAIDGGDIMQSALQGAGMGALLGGATGAMQDFRPRKLTPAEMALTDDERYLRIRNIDNQLDELGPVSMFDDSPEAAAKRARIRELKDAREAYTNYFDSVEDYKADKEARNEAIRARREQEAMARKVAKQQEAPAPYEVTPEKQRMFDRLQEVNPMTDDYHTGIRRPGEIATLEELLKNEHLRNELDPAYLNRMDRALANNDITIYSSKPIEEGVFVSPDERMAQDHAGHGNQVYSKTISPKDIAWIDAEQGNYLPRNNGTHISVGGDNEYKLYHQTKANSLADFDPKYRQSISGDAGVPEGLFLKPTDDDIGLEGQNQLELYATMNNPYIVENRDKLKQYAVNNDRDYFKLLLNEEKINKKYQALSDAAERDFDDAYKKYYYDKTDDNKKILDQKQAAWDKVNNDWENATNENAQAARNELTKFFKSQGYDSVILNEDEGSNNRVVQSNIVFGLDQLDDKKVPVRFNNLEKTLADADIAVNGAQASKVAPGESLSIEPNEKTKRAIEIIQQAGDWGRPVENELYNRIDASTLPEGYDRLRRYLDDKEYIFNTVNEKIGADNVFDADADKMLDFLYPKEPQEKKVYYKSLKESIEKYKHDAAALGLDASDAERRVTLQKKSDLFDKVVDRVKFDAQAEMGRGINLSDDVIQAMSEPEHRGIRTGYPGALDTILSERLGIAPGNTIKISDARFDYADDMSDFFNSQPASGRYMRFGKDISVRNTPDTEGAVSTMAHERLHSFQNESTPENIGRYSKEVTDAYKELSKDLKPFIKDWNDIREIHKGYKTDYYSKPIEQESRMLQQYLDNKGITDGAMFWRNKALEGGKPEWGNEINPAFDKFFDKLRDLSKRGVALPALAGLFGGGVVLDQVLNSKDSDKDKKKTKRSA